VLTPRNAISALAALAALGVTTAALAADGGSPKANGARAAAAGASAYQREESDGSQKGYVTASGDDSNRGVGTRVAASTAGGKGSASASARIRNVNLFGGLVTAGAVSVSARATGGGRERTGVVRKLVVNGDRQGTVARRTTFDLGGYGKLVVLDDRGRGILGLRATLTSDYNDFPAGTTVKIAYATASARDAVAPPRPAKPKHARPEPKPAKPKPGKPGKPAKAKRKKPPRTKALLTSKGFVFPVYGKHTFTDDWGAPRADTGHHEGNDIFATAGTPAVAVCKGTLHRVGTNVVPGNRLWVKCDKGGDEFFYAHLSAFADDAHSGAHVSAGQVVGFVGSTGDAEQTPPHLHFEVHPGGGGAVDPYPFLRAWENRRDVPAAAWVKANGAGAGQQPGTLVVVRDFLDR
jgi:murein DD-endopeptidase MepM/ murein hydrolase activator NlpD